VSNNVFNIFWQGFAWRGALEEVLSNIEWNEPKTIKLDIFVEHKKSTSNQRQYNLKRGIQRLLMSIYSQLRLIHALLLGGESKGGHIVKPSVATLALGSRPRQRACKGVSQEEAR
jgi:hypothetical protein